ncbi:hypothetical protein PMAYCL1PPCAC_22234, partial [Pristionchus mayeri]
ITFQGKGSEGVITRISPDFDQFLYFVVDGVLYVLDTKSVAFLPPLRITGADNINTIVGVHRGLLTATRWEGDENFVMTVQLPRGYFQDVLNDQ